MPIRPLSGFFGDCSAESEGLFNTLFGEFNFGALSEDDLMRSITLFGTQVLPRLREYQPY